MRLYCHRVAHNSPDIELLHIHLVSLEMKMCFRKAYKIGKGKWDGKGEELNGGGEMT